MKRLYTALWLSLLLVSNLYSMNYIDVSSPGNTVVQSTPIGTFGDQVRIDYYAAGSFGTNFKLVRGGGTNAQLYMYNNSRLTLSGGVVGGDLWFYGNSTGEIISGTASVTRVTGNSYLHMTGGSIGASYYTGIYDNGRAEIVGGQIGGTLQITGNGLATLSGSNFKLGGQTLPMGLLNIPQLVNAGLLQVFDYSQQYQNIQYQGNLTGVLSDGHSFNLLLAFTHFTDSRGNTANLCLTPEPCTLLLLGVGGMILRKRLQR